MSSSINYYIINFGLNFCPPISFLTYKSALSGIKNLLSDWDRVKGVTRPKQLPPPVEPEQGKVSATPKKKGRKVQLHV